MEICILTTSSLKLRQQRNRLHRSSILLNYHHNEYVEQYTSDGSRSSPIFCFIQIQVQLSKLVGVPLSKHREFDAQCSSLRSVKGAVNTVTAVVTDAATAATTAATNAVSSVTGTTQTVDAPPVVHPDETPISPNAGNTKEKLERQLKERPDKKELVDKNILKGRSFGDWLQYFLVLIILAIDRLDRCSFPPGCSS